jgi:lipopolysaccharide/colanic/teichoic acid biosynthesis glycosyltransferase
MLLPGRWVQVRPVDEILATLDERGRTDGLPFLPEMADSVGRTFRVELRADATCVHPPRSPFPRLEGTVTLAGRVCDGRFHGGCQLGCALFWREAWLQPVTGPSDAPEPTADPGVPPDARLLDRLELHPDGDPERWTCQATELPGATRPGRPFWSPFAIATLLLHRTYTPTELAARFAALGMRRGRRIVADALARRPAAPPGTGALPPADGAAPVARFQPGDAVRIRSAAAIAATLDEAGTNRGLRFGGDMRAEVGRSRRVRTRVERIVDERTGRLRIVRDTVILEGSTCDRYLGCARAMPFLWRESWLEPAAGSAEVAAPRDPSTASVPPAPPIRTGRWESRQRIGLATKRLIDIAGALVAIVVLAPVLAGIALGVLVTLGRPILFRQVRPGRHGQPFTIRKFRTMRPPRDGEVFWATDDARITRLGRFLRSSSLDELPELWNVVVGDMSLVGPRPLLTEYLATYTPDQARRHDLRPGITSWAAVNGRHAARFEDRLALDTWYVDHWSPLLDLRIIARTIVQVLRRTDVSATQDLDAVGFPLPGVGGRPTVSG